MIVDTSAVMAILLGEPDGSILAQAMQADPDVRISAATLVESFIVANAADAATDLQDLLRASAIKIEQFTAHQAGIASAASRRYGRGSGHAAHLNLGDTFAYALAMDAGEPLLFKGRDFSQTDVRSAL